MTTNFIDELIFRVPNFFIHRTTGKVLDYRSLSNRKEVLTNPSKWLLPLGVERKGIEFINTGADGVINITFKKTAQNLNYVIGQAKDTITKQFIYRTKDGLKEQVGDYLTELMTLLPINGFQVANMLIY